MKNYLLHIFFVPLFISEHLFDNMLTIHSFNVESCDSLFSQQLKGFNKSSKQLYSSIECFDCQPEKLNLHLYECSWSLLVKLKIIRCMFDP